MAAENNREEGVDLWHKVEGEGKRNFVLIHNAGGDHNFLNEQFKFLCRLGTVLTLDLRGHGQSSKPKEGYSFQNLAKDIESLCKANNLEKVTVVGLNIGANIGLELALCSNIVASLVFIEPPILMNRATSSLVKKELKELKKSSADTISKMVVEDVVFRTSLENKHMAMKAFQESSLFAREQMYENLLLENKNYARKLKKIHCPVLIIQTNSPFSSKQELSRACPQMLYGQVVGSGPWASFEVPAQVNSMIERFIQFHIASL